MDNTITEGEEKEKISTIVPQVAHVDQSEHSVQVVVTEHGVADLRKKDPQQRAEEMIASCAEPSFREELRAYCSHTHDGHSPFAPAAAFAIHQQFMETGDMHGLDWGRYFGKK